MPPTTHPFLPVNLVSSLLLLTSVTISLWYWSTRKNLTETKLVVAFAGLIGAFVGAKLGYVLAEAPIRWDDQAFWLRMLAGKTILGGLLGGWLGVEAAKRACGIHAIMGDEFARIIPLGIAIGRLGCWFSGCCPGQPVGRVLPDDWATWLEGLGVDLWPAPLVEIAFQLTFWLSCWGTKNVAWIKGQQFHGYLIAYGIFRLLHEPFRGTVRYAHSDLSPYMILAGFVACCGAVGFIRRRAAFRQHKATPPEG